jgi:NADH-quinone oxidoreductase subunit C/D
MPDVVSMLKEKFQEAILSIQVTKDEFPTLWADAGRIIGILDFLKNELARPYKMLYDLTAIDEQAKNHRDEHPESIYTIVYQLLSFERNSFIRIKVPLTTQTVIPSVTTIWAAANWYEREVYDLFGVKFTGHPDHPSSCRKLNR